MIQACHVILTHTVGVCHIFRVTSCCDFCTTIFMANMRGVASIAVAETVISCKEWRYWALVRTGHVMASLVCLADRVAVTSTVC